MKPERRFKIRNRPPIGDEAQRCHDEDVKFQLLRLDWVVADLREAMKRPLSTEISEQIEVKPGEAGYDKAEYALGNLSGHWNWIQDP